MAHSIRFYVSHIDSDLIVAERVLETEPNTFKTVDRILIKNRKPTTSRKSAWIRRAISLLRQPKVS